MKRKCILVAIAILSLSMLIGGCSIRVGKIFRTNNNIEEEKLFKGKGLNESINIDGIKRIDVEIYYGDIDIKPYDGNEIKVNINCDAEDTRFEKIGNDIKILDEDLNFNLDFGILERSDKKRNVLIEVPRSFKGDLEFKCGAGVVNIENLKLERFNIEGGAGKLNIRDISFKDLDLKQGVGEITLNLGEKSGNIDIEGGVGSTKLYMNEVGGDIKIDGGVGECIVDIPKNSPVKINTESGLGNVQVKESVSEEDKYKLEIKSGIGSIIIK